MGFQQKTLVLTTGRTMLLAANYLLWKFLPFLGCILCFTEQTVEFTMVQKPKTRSVPLLKSLELTAG